MEYRLEFNSGDSDIKRCLNYLYSTRAGSQPMDRDFGINYDGVVGKPIEVAKNTLALEIISKTEKYEPRVIVDSVDFSVDELNGQLIPIIHIMKGDENDE